MSSKASASDAVRPAPYGKEQPPPGKGLPQLTESSGLSDYLEYAALNNPGLQAAFNRWKAALERIPQVRALPEPRLTYRYFVKQMDTRQSVGLEQMFPWFGKLKLDGDAAFEAAEVERERWEAAKVRLINEVKQTYYEYYYLSRALTVTEENRELMKYLESVARAKYKVATAQQADLIRAQVELGKLENDVRSLTALREPSAARLNAALNRPVSADLPWPKSIAQENINMPDEEILARLGEANPELRSLNHEIAQQKVARARAKKEYYPDITLGVEYMDSISPQPDEFALMFGVTLPVWTKKYRAMEREAVLRQRAAVLDRADRQNMLNADAKMAIYGLRDAERKINLYRDTLLPIAKQALKSTEAAYAVGTATFSDLVDTERTLLEFTLSSERALADHAQRLAELEMLVGRELPRGMPEQKAEPKSGEPGPPEKPSEMKPEQKNEDDKEKTDTSTAPEKTGTQ